MFPGYAHSMATGINMGRNDEPTYPDPQTGIPQRCARLPDNLRRECEASFCVRNPFTAFCLANKNQMVDERGNIITNPVWARSRAMVMQSRRPQLKILARRMRTKIDQRNAAAAAAEAAAEEARQLQYFNMAQDVFSRGSDLGPAFARLPHGQQAAILRSMFDQLNPDQQDIMQTELYPPSGSPRSPPHVSLSPSPSSSLFGKKKAKRKTKKTSKQTRK
tara:strand:- start:28 stop:684 length:657 start_codon:yes stop_codon:yes gene_type:complete